jgi:aromatic ring-opening dioxygenase catalytic subunit (LigB family)
MAKLVLGIGTSHSPQLNFAAEQWHMHRSKDETDPRMNYAERVQRVGERMAAEITPEKMQQRDDACQKALATLGEVIREVSPDVILAFGDDQKEQFHDDNMPSLCIYHGEQLPNGRARYRDPSNWRSMGAHDIETAPENYTGEPDLASYLLDALREDFDLARSNRLKEDVGIGHAFNFVYRRLIPDRDDIPMVPFMVNTYYPPNAPSPKRCYLLGQAVREAIEAWDADVRVAVIASGGLSHTVIDEEIDKITLDAMMEKDPEPLWALPENKLVNGTSEIRNWIVAAGAMEQKSMTLVDYVPTYRSLAGTGCGMAFAYWK